MSEPQPISPEPGRWKRPAYLLVVLAALALVMFVWFHTPEVEVASDNGEDGYITLRCANAGPSRWEPPTVRPGQELSGDATSQAFDLLILKNDIESLHVGLACGQARDTHTNTLIVTTFVAGTIIFLGYAALWMRRARPEASEHPA